MYTAIIFIVLGFIVLVLWMLFGIMNRTIKSAHNIKINDLIRAYSLHDVQIQNRQRGLKTYDFMVYNLNHALIVQSQIRV